MYGECSESLGCILSVARADLLPRQSCFDTPPPSGQDPPGRLPLLPAHLRHPPPQVKIPLEGCPSCPRASITLQLSSDPWVYRPEQAVRGALAMYRTPGPRTLVLQLLEGGGKLLAMCVCGGGGQLKGGGAAVIVVAVWGGAAGHVWGSCCRVHRS